MIAATDIARTLRHALDPVAFAIERLGWTPDPWQADVMRAGSKPTLLNCSRQSGKSTSTSVIALHTALYQPGSLILLIAPSLRQAGLLFDKLTSFLKVLDPKPKLEEDNRLSVTLDNGSRVVALPGAADTIRGFSAPRLVIEDEAAFVPDDLHRAVRPMLATSGGRLILMSTPHGRRGHFYEAWANGGDEWERVSVTAQDCPRIPPEFLVKERKALGEWWFRQEYQCEFLETADQVFRSEDIERAMTDEIAPLFIPDTTVKPLFGAGV